MVLREPQNMFGELISGEGGTRCLNERDRQGWRGSGNRRRRQEISSRLNRSLAAGMRHRHPGPVRLAAPAHFLAALFFFRSQLPVRNHARHDRPSEKEDSEKGGEDGRAPHGLNLTFILQTTRGSSPRQ